MPADTSPLLATPIVILAITLSGAVVLLMLDVWLRRKGVQDPTLIWLGLSLLSWALVAAVQLIPSARLANELGIRTSEVPYLFSPVSSILFTVTAFRLSRVRELFRSHDLRRWPAAIVIIVSAISVTAVASLLLGSPVAGAVLDAVASSVALIALAGGMLYSFYKYGNQLMAALAAITFTYFIARQFLNAAFGPAHGVLAALQVAGTSTLAMLLIALAVAWGLSETSRTRIVGQPAQVTIAALLLDLRGSSQWTQNVIGGDYHYAGTFMDELRAWAWSRAMAIIPERPNLVKFLGDGFLFVWEIPQNASEIEDRSAAVVELACCLHREYSSWCSANNALWKSVPRGLGIGVDAGTAIRLTFENGSEDYIGNPINNCSRLQYAARPAGGVVMREDLCARLRNYASVSEQFPRSGVMSLPGGQALGICATEDVELPMQFAITADAGYSP